VNLNLRVPKNEGDYWVLKESVLAQIQNKPLLITRGEVKVLTKYFIFSGFHQTSGVLCTVQL
jgi:hypothetical protein